jgi:hypothetical protein
VFLFASYDAHAAGGDEPHDAVAADAFGERCGRRRFAFGPFRESRERLAHRGPRLVVVGDLIPGQRSSRPRPLGDCIVTLAEAADQFGRAVVGSLWHQEEQKNPSHLMLLRRCARAAM